MQSHAITRVRRETRRRKMKVDAVTRVTPRMLRFDFISDDLHDFDSAAHDDHVKLFVPDPRNPDEPNKRDFTPRSFDPAGGTLTLDFALHDAGPATEWAVKAKAGDTIEIGGPRGSTVVTDDFDWYVLIGDETALPAIGRRVENLRPGVPVFTFMTVAGENEAQIFKTQAAHTPTWIVRSPQVADEAALKAALEKLKLPPGDGFVWVGAEASVARAMRDYFFEVHKHPKSWIKAAGYWKRGAVSTHEKIED